MAPLVLLGDGLGEIVGLGLGEKSGLASGLTSGDGLAGGFDGAQALIMALILRLNRLSMKPIRCDFA